MSLVPPDFVEHPNRAEVGCPICGAVDELVFFPSSGGVASMFVCRPCTKVSLGDVPGVLGEFERVKGIR